jgi:hypothetical protein
MATVEIPWGQVKVKQTQELKKAEEPTPAPLKEWVPATPEVPAAPPDVQIAETTHKCPSCGGEVSDARTELLGILECAFCTPQAEKPLGIPDYGHKTGGSLMIVTDRKLFKLLKRPINQQR